MRNPSAFLGAMALICALVPASVHATPIALPLDGSWTVLDDAMLAGQFFTGGGLGQSAGAATLADATTWTFTSTSPVQFDITDYFVATDRYEIFDNGGFLAALSGGTPWSSIPGCNGQPLDVSCHWVATPDEGFVAPFFAHGSLLLGPGSHSIAIRSVEIPIDGSGAPYFDGTVAFRVSETPEPASMLLLGTGLCGIGAAMRQRRRAGRSPFPRSLPSRHQR